MTGCGLDPRLGAAPTNFQQNQGGSGEGFLVPTEYREQIWALVFDDQNLLGFCNLEPTQGNSIAIAKDETTPSGASGVQALWRSEGTQMIADKAERFRSTGHDEARLLETSCKSGRWQLLRLRFCRHLVMNKKLKRELINLRRMRGSKSNGSQPDQTMSSGGDALRQVRHQLPRLCPFTSIRLWPAARYESTPLAPARDPNT
ncbi:hypothetical protein [Bradyrhizobium sp. BR 1433]|uniref:hypothetical protein n=1 Tax=Bradyrhizobium sp. BR 1433 TaxID=3447967 RepID=UPI003EE72606